ncbi:hypothetical protein C8A01DRAFT_20491 [Parachaetomium inaequale]|uniref:Kelch repeat protein n=1 Tax=Parachaetomium inaequale TaxID=2588326 RepID=A0AAN6P618_9PEZI|nr:hypothetical protein C8A01DRAFT_20491 [Parachaetomium inaequale]
MPSRWAVASLLALFGPPSLVDAELFDAPTPANFVRRSSMRATVLGNHVYIDGGEISQLVDGKLPAWDINPVNSTLSIDLSKSWTSSDVSFRTISKPGPSLGKATLWTDTAAGRFYTWGGMWSRGLNMTRPRGIWRFDADKSGGGAWSLETPTNFALFIGLHPGEQGAFAHTNNTGFLIGGLASGWTELGRGPAEALPGMVTFDMETKIFRNGTTNYSPFDTLVGATAQYIPSYGPNGLILVLGGHAPLVGKEYSLDDAPPFDLQNLTFFDPSTKEAYWQESTGDIPPSPRTLFCTVGFQVPGGGYDIFLFGGSNARDKYEYEDAYVLSLPGFVWTKVPTPPAGPRHSHTCVSAGNRQVLSIGGLAGDWRTADTAPQGLLLFDMATMAWKDSYDTNAAAYEQAEVIKSWYGNGSQERVQWTSDKVKALFVAASESSPSPTPTPIVSVEPTTATSPPVGAIVGGVVGGIAGLAALVAVAWVLLRRRTKNPSYSATPRPQGYDFVSKEADDDGPAGPYTRIAAAEVDVGSGYSELLGSARHGGIASGQPAVRPPAFELDQRAIPRELPAESPWQAR